MGAIREQRDNLWRIFLTLPIPISRRRKNTSLSIGELQQIKTPGRSRGFFSPRSIISAGRLVGRPVRAFGSAAGSADRASAGRLVGRPVRAFGSAAGSAVRSDLDCSGS